MPPTNITFEPVRVEVVVTDERGNEKEVRTETKVVRVPCPFPSLSRLYQYRPVALDRYRQTNDIDGYTRELNKRYNALLEDIEAVKQDEIDCKRNR